MKAFSAHMHEGEPGHCVSRSGLLAGVLLATNRPARVVQIYSPQKRGHNVVEVWDEKDGWVIVDPTFLTLFRPGPGDALASRTAEPISPTTAVELFSDKGVHLDDPPAYYFDEQDGLLRGPRVYPEPWLYLRTGPRFAPYPYRGKFLVPGAPLWHLGPVQTLLQRGILLCAALLLLSVFLETAKALGGWISRRMQGKGRVADPSPLPAHRVPHTKRERDGDLAGEDSLIERASERRSQQRTEKVERNE
jgi:hypothetical protein